MIVSIKDIFKMLGMLIVSFCAVIVCTMFLNYYLDLSAIDDQITHEVLRIFYEAQCNTSIVISEFQAAACFLPPSYLFAFT